MKIGGMILCGYHEPYLEYCLSSITNICDKIAIVCPEEFLQTAENVCQIVGCQEKTTIEVQNTEELDFSSWRNQCLDILKDCSWCSWLDADEILANRDGSPVTKKDILDLINHNDKMDTFIFPTLHFMYNYFTLDASGKDDILHRCIRLFKNDGRKFRRRVHEELFYNQETTAATDNLGFEMLIWHFGHCKGMEDLANRYRERHIPENPFTGHMSKEELEAYLKVHNKLRGRYPVLRYDGPLPKVMNLW